jgi:hypothetical protein
MCVALPPGLLLNVRTPSSPIALAVDLSTPAAEVGLPFTATVHVVTEYSPWWVTWSDTEGQTGMDPEWTVVPQASGPLAIQARVTNAAGATGSANVSIVVSPPPVVRLHGSVTEGDADTPLTVEANLSGGVPPYSLQWTEPETNSSGTLSGLLPGTYPVLVEFPNPGPAWLFARMTDALGATATNASQVATIVALPELSIFLSPGTTEAGALVGLVGEVQGGAPPLRWSVQSSLPVARATLPEGSMAGPGTFDWNATFATPGIAAITVSVEDAAGAIRIANTSFPILPHVAVNTTSRVTLEPGGRSAFSITIDGGLAPYAYSFQLSDGEYGTGNATGPGPVAWEADPGTPGLYSLQVQVTDALGQSARAGATVRLGSASATSVSTGPPSPPGTSPWVLASLGLIVLCAAGAWLWYRQSHSRGGRAPAADARRETVAVVHRLLAGSPGIDREMLLLLAEEEGEAPELVGDVLSRLERSGHVIADPGPGDEVSLRWRDASTPEPPGGSAGSSRT